jgi:hypothetical protein
MSEPFGRSVGRMDNIRPLSSLFIVLPPYPLPKTYGRWVRREG